MANASQFEEVVERKFKGDSVKLDILRDKQPMTVSIKLFKPGHIQFRVTATTCDRVMCFTAGCYFNR